MTAEHRLAPEVHDRVVTQMLGVAVDTINGAGENAHKVGWSFNDILSYGQNWVRDPSDPRGLALRAYAERLTAMIAQVDAEGIA